MFNDPSAYCLVFDYNDIRLFGIAWSDEPDAISLVVYSYYGVPEVSTG